MKKIIIYIETLLLSLILLTGCGKQSEIVINQDNYNEKIESTSEYLLLQENIENAAIIFKDHGVEVTDDELKSYIETPGDLTYYLNADANGMCGEFIEEGEHTAIYKCNFYVESGSEVELSDLDGIRVIDKDVHEVQLKIGEYEDISFSTEGKLQITGINAFEHVVCTTKVVNDNAKYDSSVTWSDLGVICEIESENAEEHVFSYVDDSGKPVEIGIPNAQFSRVNFYGNIIEIVIYDGYDIDSYKGDVKDINISYDGKSKVFKFPKLQDSTTEDFEPYINNMYIRVNRYGKDKGNFYEDSSMK